MPIFPHSKKFQRRIENFTCEVCFHEVSGNGYTNHCPHCLHSKHVDIHPGDRENTCCGIMRPIGCEYKKGNLYLVHQCVKCSLQKVNKVSDDDNFDEITKLMQKNASSLR